MRDDHLTSGSDGLYDSVSSVRKTSPLDDFIDGNIRNPVPKPPRSVETDLSTKEYMNLGEYRTESGINDDKVNSEPATDFDIDLMDSLGSFASAMDAGDAEELRPLPPVPDGDESNSEADRNILSESEIGELYATVDKAMRQKLKEGPENSERDHVPSDNDKSSQDNSEPERPQLDRYDSKDVSNLEEGKFRIQVNVKSLEFIYLLVT